MTVSRLSLTDFRSYADAVLAPGPGLRHPHRRERRGEDQCAGGGLAALAGARAARRVARRDGAARRVAAASRLPRDWARLEIGTGTAPAAPERRQVRVNGAPASANSLSEWLSVLWLTPAMDRLFADAASGRRRFLDRLVLALRPDHAMHSARYEAAMRARNKLLGEDGPWDEAWLDALEARMAEHGAVIAEARAAAVAALDERLAEAPEGPFARARLALEGGESADLRRAPARRDAAAGRTLAGPHRADLAVTHVGKDQPAALCSTGEQKALLIGLILAHADLVAARTGRRPILLLDEIAAHLDPCGGPPCSSGWPGGGQVWMTGTEPSLFAGIGAAHWLEVSTGRIRPAPAGFLPKINHPPRTDGACSSSPSSPRSPTPKICRTCAPESAPNAAPPIRVSAARWRPITRKVRRDIAGGYARARRDPRARRHRSRASSRASPRRRSARSAIGYAIAYLQLFIHEAAHYNLAPTRQANDRLADRLICWQVGTSIAAYRRTHAEHHRHLGGPDDTEISYTHRLTPRFLHRDGHRHPRAARLHRPRRRAEPGEAGRHAEAAPRRRGRASRSSSPPCSRSAPGRRRSPGSAASASSSPCSRPCASCSSIARRPARPRHDAVTRMFGDDLFSRTFGGAGFNRHLLHHIEPQVSYTRYDALEACLMNTSIAPALDSRRASYGRTFAALVSEGRRG